MEPMIEVLKAKKFEWNENTQATFKDIKDKLANALIFSLSSFSIP